MPVDVSIDKEDRLITYKATGDVTLAEMEKIIRDAGYEPKRRKQDYSIIEHEEVGV